MLYSTSEIGGVLPPEALYDIAKFVEYVNATCLDFAHPFQGASDDFHIYKDTRGNGENQTAVQASRYLFPFGALQGCARELTTSFQGEYFYLPCHST
jgi:hypothetical protein